MDKDTQTPACLWFSQQESVGIWDEAEVLDALEQWLIEKKETYKRFPPNENNSLGHFDIFCATSEHYGKIRTRYETVRGTV
jgi:hypothetical protein